MIRVVGMFALLLFVGVSVSVAGAQSPGSAAEETRLADRIAALVAQLDANRAPQRRAAEQTLVDLAAGDDAEEVLALLPAANDRMPPSVRSGLKRVRRRIEKSLAELAVEATRVTIDADAEPLADVLRSIGDQTGNRLSDGRSRFGGGGARTPVSLMLDDEPFWPAVDRLLDAAKLDVYAYGGDYELSLVARGDGVGPRFGRAAYAGPFRFEPVRVVATRGLRSTSEASLDVLLEVSWEPRLQPIALSQPMRGVAVKSESGAPLSARQPERQIDVEVTPGTQGVEMTLSFVLPDRSTERIASLAGELDALVPGRQADFRFEAVGAATSPVKRQRGDATVSLERFKRSGPVWELRMRLRLDNATDAFASHRGWVFQNLSYLETADGARIEHAGFETVLQTENEVGLVYLFDLADLESAEEGEAGIDPRRLTWVYRTPVSVVSLPVKYELSEILLP